MRTVMLKNLGFSYILIFVITPLLQKQSSAASALFCTNDTNLAASYPFNGSATDESGNGRDGIVSGATLTVDRFGASRSAYLFNGTGSTIRVPDAGLTNGLNFTISFWENSTGQARMHALSLGTTLGANLDFDFNDAAGLWLYWNSEGGHAIRTGAQGEFTDGAWHHVLLRRSGGSVELYMDGKLRGSAAYSEPIGVSEPLTVGRGSTVIYPWVGKIDEVRVWNRAVTSTEINALAADAPPATVARWNWSLVRPQAEFPRLDGSGALVFGGKMWLLGGWAPGSRPAPYTMNDIWSSTNGSAWTWMGNAPWEPRHTAGYAVHDGRMWVVGGDANSGHYQNDVWSSLDGVNWALVTNNVPWGGRVLHHVVSFAGKIWLMGGQKLPQFLSNGPTNEMFYNDVWTTTNGADWTRVLEHAPWTPRGMIGGSAVFNNRLWLLGGGTYDTPLQPRRSYYNEVWNTADGINWTKVLQNAPWEPRQYHDVAVFDGRMWVLEGYHGRNLNDVWSSPDGVTWSQLEATPWPARHAASVFVYSNALWMVAGNLWNDVWKLTVTNQNSVSIRRPFPHLLPPALKQPGGLVRVANPLFENKPARDRIQHGGTHSTFLLSPGPGNGPVSVLIP